MLLFCTMLGLVTGQPAQTAAPAATAGSEWVKALQTNYQDGKYKSFIAEMDRVYKDGQAQNSWQPLLDREQAQIKKFNTPEGKSIYENALAKRKSINKEITQIKRDQNQQLQKIALAYPNTSISLVINDITNHQLTDKELSSLEQLDEWITSPISQHAETPLLKQLKEVNFESNIKYRLLNAAFNQGDKKSNILPDFGKMDENQMEEYLMVLTFDKLSKMQKLAQNSNEEDIKQVISTVVQTFPVLAAQLYDNKLLEQQIQNASSPADQEAAKIIQNSNQKLAEIVKKYTSDK